MSSSHVPLLARLRSARTQPTIMNALGPSLSVAFASVAQVPLSLAIDTVAGEDDSHASQSCQVIDDFTSFDGDLTGPAPPPSPLTLDTAPSTPRPGHRSLSLSQSSLPPTLSMEPMPSAHSSFSDGDSEPDQDDQESARRQELEHYRILAAAGLVRYPPHSQSSKPPVPPRRINHLGGQPQSAIAPDGIKTPRIEIDRTLAPLHQPTEHTNASQNHLGEEKMQDALTRYLRL